MAKQRSRGRRKPGRPATIRLTGGQWRGTRLPVTDADGLRPTAERVRETLFNWLAPMIEGAHCIDCFAGTGALGLEALSRGAAHVDFFDTDRTTANALRERLDMLGANTRATVTASDFRHASLPASSIDIAFVDPPFAHELQHAAIERLRPALTSNARVYFEHPAAQAHEFASLIDPVLETLRHKRAGAVGFGLARPYTAG
ncbi:16S rRNA (guanine(966)-N(2))-methyltransferase RsmD [Salinisphaera orenii]|uniref:16S rRNA (guanine(966)-N(2))-methyltransferase RsmD n=1 Tax=Salinisphaera orenii TaxID=856731 RepID=UPI000DBE6AE3